VFEFDVESPPKTFSLRGQQGKMVSVAARPVFVLGILAAWTTVVAARGEGPQFSAASVKYSTTAAKASFVIDQDGTISAKNVPLDGLIKCSTAGAQSRHASWPVPTWLGSFRNS
jgi:hypothetical protein